MKFNSVVRLLLVFAHILAALSICLPAAAQTAFDSARRPADDKPLRILRITPQGADVPAGRQIVLQFDRPVVPIGRMEREAQEIPITIAPALDCEWRWLNTSALSCNLTGDNSLAMATRYQVRIEPGIATESGVTLAQGMRHEFITQRPGVVYARFVNWLSPGKPMLQVTFNQPVSKSSVQSALNFRPVARPGQEQAINAYPDTILRELPAWMERFIAQSEQDGRQAREVDDRLTVIDGDEARRVWIIIPAGELPGGSPIDLYVRPGLVSSEGPEPGIEHRSVVRFDTFPAFSFLGIRCTLKGSEEKLELSPQSLAQYALAGDASAVSRCAPLKPVALSFSSPVPNSMVRDNVSLQPPLDGGREDYDPWQNVSDWTLLNRPHIEGQPYYLWFPALLQAYQAYQLHIDSARLRDEFGRLLENSAELNALAFFTGHREPDLTMNHSFAVLEKELDTDVPLYITNLKRLDYRYQKWTGAGRSGGLTRSALMPQAEDVAFAHPMGARGLIGPGSGVLQGSLMPDPVPPGYRQDEDFFVQVSPFQLHVKMGHFSSLVWVTDFAKGKAVRDAKVTLYKGSYDNLIEMAQLDYNAETDRQGLAPLPGIAELDPELNWLGRYQPRHEPRYFVRVEKAGDSALIPLDYHFQIRSYEVYPNLRRQGGHTHAWGATAQGVYKLGDRVQYKVYVREQSNRHWVLPASGQTYDLQVIDPQGKSVHERTALSLSEFGAIAGEFKIAEQGVMGWYRFLLQPSVEPGARTSYPRLQPLSVLVSDFTPAPFRVSAELNGAVFRAGQQVRAEAIASLHSGGPFAAAELRLTARLQPMPLSFANPKLSGFYFGGYDAYGSADYQSTVLDVRGTLNREGGYQEMFELPQADFYYAKLSLEAAVKDDRGKYVAATTEATFAGRDRYVGLRNTQWLYEQGKAAAIEAVAVDAEGNPIEASAIEIEILRQQYKASRVKGPGNAYLTKNIAEWVEQAKCRLLSERDPVACNFTPDRPGSYRITAKIHDTQGRVHNTAISAWVTGNTEILWQQRNDATLEMVPEKNQYRIGETARYLIKNPFPGSKALVTVERYGVLDHWMQTLDGNTPVIEFKVKEDYLPGFYLSVVVQSPRVEQPLGPGRIDLGKPSYRMGYAATLVQDPEKQIELKVATDKDSYKPRQKVKAKIKVGKGHTNGEPVELAVAVIDESVLALNQSGAGYYDPYAGFNRLDDLDLTNYSLMSRLIGRQKFEKKGANPGGDGAGNSFGALRNLFKYVSYWNPSVIPDRRGNAEVEFEVPDNLTGWRVLVMAVTPNDRFGLGQTSFKVNKATELRPVMPNQVVEGDRFSADFSLFNRSAKKRDFTLVLDIEGPLAETSETHFQRSVSLEPYQRITLGFPVLTQGHGELRFRVDAADDLDGDALEHKIPVNARRVLDSAASYGTTLMSMATESVLVPDGIYPDAGSISLVLAPSVIGNIDGAFRYLKNYPYWCWEQRLTKAVAASTYLRLQDYLAEDLRWPDAGQSIARTLEDAARFQAPNGGMTFWLPSNRNVSPYLSAYTALAFNWLRRDGHDVPEDVERRLHAYLKNMLRQDVFPSFYHQGMASSVRAVALAALAEQGQVTAADVDRYLSHVPRMDLFGRAHFLLAALRTGTAGEVKREAFDSILAHASQSGGKVQFNEVWDDSYSYLLATPLRGNCAVLSALLSAQQEQGLGEQVQDLAVSLVRAITQARGRRDYWQNTQENMFCLNALVDYSRQYESQAPAFQVEVKLDDEALGGASFASLAAEPVEVKRDLTAADAGRAATISIAKQGQGRLYYAARLSYSLKQDRAQRVNSGIEIRREFSVERNGRFELLTSPMQVRRGELLRVDLFVSLPTARHFVVVDDPVPGGLEPVNTDLATASVVDAGKSSFKAAEGSFWFNLSDWQDYGRHFWSFYHKELAHDAARFYADYLPAGNYHLSYSAQVIAQGEFSVMPVQAKEMYDPDVYGTGLPATLRVSSEQE